MEHKTAIDTMATERYLLGEMNENETEKNDFEDHFFDCRVCSDAVRGGATFLDSGKSIVREPKTRNRVAVVWFPTAVAAMLAVIVGLQAIRPPRPPTADQPFASRVSFVRLADTRASSADQTVVTLRRGQQAALTFDIVSEVQYPGYRWAIRDASGAAKAAETLSAEVATDPISIQLSNALPVGKYHLVVEGLREGSSGTEIARYPFVVEQAE